MGGLWPPGQGQDWGVPASPGLEPWLSWSVSSFSPLAATQSRDPQASAVEILRGPSFTQNDIEDITSPPPGLGSSFHRRRDWDRALPSATHFGNRTDGACVCTELSGVGQRGLERSLWGCRVCDVGWWPGSEPIWEGEEKQLFFFSHPDQAAWYAWTWLPGKFWGEPVCYTLGWPFWAARMGVWRASVRLLTCIWQPSPFR